MPTKLFDLTVPHAPENPANYIMRCINQVEFLQDGQGNPRIARLLEPPAERDLYVADEDADSMTFRVGDTKRSLATVIMRWDKGDWETRIQAEVYPPFNELEPFAGNIVTHLMQELPKFLSSGVLMKWELMLVVNEQSLIGVKHLQEETLKAVIEEFMVDYNYETSGDEFMSAVDEERGLWTVLYHMHPINKLVPQTVGSVMMIVKDREPPYGVTFFITNGENNPTLEFTDTIQLVAERFISRYKLEGSLRKMPHPRPLSL